VSERLRARLEATPLDPEAEERTWALVRLAYAQRTPARRPLAVPLHAALVLAAVAAAIIAATLSPPGQAVVNAVRRSLGIEHAAPALFRLPSAGRLLVSGGRGTWLVSADGSRQRLGPYPAAAWSPHALYIVVASPGGLAAIDPQGGVHWRLPRAARLPAWGGTRADTRVAYLAGGRLHVVGGDGRGDLRLGRAAPVAPAWRPSQPEQHVLAWVDAAGRVVVGVPGRAPLWRSSPLRPHILAWSPDGRRLAVVTAARLLLLDGRTGAAAAVAVRGVRALAYAADGRLALVRGRSLLLVGRAGETRTLFSAPSRLAGLAWSPDGRWLLTALPAAGQWVFVGPHRVVAVSNIQRQFGRGATLDGWAPGA
jgi:hypothetical protein